MISETLVNRVEEAVRPHLGATLSAPNKPTCIITRPGLERNRWPSDPHIRSTDWDWHSRAVEFGFKPRIRIVSHLSTPTTPTSSIPPTSSTSSEAPRTPAEMNEPTVPVLQNRPPDPRFVTRGNQPGAPIDLFSEDGFPMHSFRMKGTNEALETGYLTRGEWKLRASEETPDVVIEHAMLDGALRHFSDGRDGSVWVIAANREDVGVALLEQPMGDWLFLGTGVEQSEKCMIMIHKNLTDVTSSRRSEPLGKGKGRVQKSDPGPSRSFSLKSLKSRVKDVKGAVTEGNKKESLFKKITRKVKEALE